MNSRTITTHWLPVLLWMALIFTGSGRIGSNQNTSRFIDPFLGWLKPDISAVARHRVHVAVRKSGHLSEYAILAMLLWRARRKMDSGERCDWSRRHAIFAIAAAIGYAITDEFHQSFVPSRLGSPWDVMIDGIGACIGMAIIWCLGRRKRYW